MFRPFFGAPPPPVPGPGVPQKKKKKSPAEQLEEIRGLKKRTGRERVQIILRLVVIFSVIGFGVYFIYREYFAPRKVTASAGGGNPIQILDRLPEGVDRNVLIGAGIALAFIILGLSFSDVFTAGKKTRENLQSEIEKEIKKDTDQLAKLKEKEQALATKRAGYLFKKSQSQDVDEKAHIQVQVDELDKEIDTMRQTIQLLEEKIERRVEAKKKRKMVVGGEQEGPSIHDTEQQLPDDMAVSRDMPNPMPVGYHYGLTPMEIEEYITQHLRRRRRFAIYVSRKGDSKAFYDVKTKWPHLGKPRTPHGGVDPRKWKRRFGVVSDIWWKWNRFGRRRMLYVTERVPWRVKVSDLAYHRAGRQTEFWSEDLRDILLLPRKPGNGRDMVAWVINHAMGYGPDDERYFDEDKVAYALRDMYDYYWGKPLGNYQPGFAGGLPLDVEHLDFFGNDYHRILQEQQENPKFTV